MSDKLPTDELAALGWSDSPDSHELARLCSLDIGREVTSNDIRTYLIAGMGALEPPMNHFTPEEADEIAATVVKEMAGGLRG